MSSHPIASPSAVSLFDARPFFEKALIFGVQHGILDAQKLEAIGNDAPKGMVQIARYFGNEHLRPELEKARDRIVNLVSLNLEHTSQGDLRLAAESLREHSFMSRSKGGSDMLKALIAMPQNSHFGMNERGGFTDEHIPLLAKWSLRSLPEYQAELAQRTEVALVVEAAIWLADDLGLEAEELEEAGKDAEAVIRTALLVLATKRTEMPDWVAFEKMVAALRKKYGAPTASVKAKAKAPATKKPASQAPVLTISVPKHLPAQFKPVVEKLAQSVQADLPKILDAALPAKKLFDQTPAFMGRYFWIEDSLNEVDHYERDSSAAWAKATGGHDDDSSLLTLFLGVATGIPPKTLLSEKEASQLVRKIRKSGLNPDLATQFIQDHAPELQQGDYTLLWEEFLSEALATLKSDFDYALKDALALLRRECNVR